MIKKNISVTNLQLKCHLIVKLSKKIGLLHKQKKIFFDSDNDRRIKFHTVVGGIPELYPVAQALIHELICLLVGNDKRWLPVSNEDVEELIGSANEYQKILNSIYDETVNEISALPPQKRNGNFLNLFRQQAIKRPQLRRHPIIDNTTRH